jgi:4'-phosphopantetheinyl transferase
MMSEAYMTSVSLTPWQAPPPRIALADRTVHLWRFSLTQDDCALDLLSPLERQRAERLLVPQKARAFTVARTRLRQILGGYLQIAPQHVSFTCNANGKPLLDGVTGARIAFNLSHSGDWGLFAIALASSVGVDLEAIRADLVFEPLAERFFSPAELGWLRSCPTGRLRRNFFRLWTRKEAWLKGKGGGFSEPELGLDSSLVAAVSASGGGWWVMNFPVTRGYVGAVAVAGAVDRIERWNWPAH